MSSITATPVIKGTVVKYYYLYKLANNKKKKYYYSFVSNGVIHCEFTWSKGEADIYLSVEEASLHIDELNINNLFIDCLETLSPDPYIDKDYKAGVRRWVEICKHNYDWYLESMPPIYHGDGYGFMIGDVFLNSEPITTSPDGKNVFLACMERDNKYYAMLMTVKEWKERKFINLEVSNGIQN